VGTDPAAIYESWRQVADGQWASGELPELWDGKAAGRIVRVLLERAR
jgi:UDP-N-acetylglucosamine 2-epimerase (non-hydrolysing)